MNKDVVEGKKKDVVEKKKDVVEKKKDVVEGKMNKDVLEGKWKEMQGQVKGWWGKLTDEELARTGGKADKLIALLQQKYGYTREQAEKEFDRRLKEAKAP